MKPSYFMLLIIRVAIMPMAIALTIVSCETHANLIQKSDLLTLPAVTVKNFETQFNDSGKLQLVLTSPLLEKYSDKEVQYTEFKSGIKAVFYEGKPKRVAEITANYAKYTDDKNLWELKDSVVVVNEKNDKLETELLFWDQAKDLIYTDRFVKITSEDQIIQGFGFESDSHLIKRRIKKVTATIYLPN